MSKTLGEVLYTGFDMLACGQLIDIVDFYRYPTCQDIDNFMTSYRVFTDLTLEPFTEVTSAICNQSTAHLYELGTLALCGPSGQGLTGDRDIFWKV
jgi:hypothetical protein